MGTKLTPQQAYEEGKKGHPVNTNGMSAEERRRIDEAVNRGKQDAHKPK